MPLRILLGAALAAAALAFGWSLFAGAGYSARSAADALLQRHTPAAARGDAGGGADPSAGEDCVTFGPFASRDAAERAGAASGARTATVEEHAVTSDPDYLVYVPPRGSFELARLTARQLAAAGVEAHVIPTGDLATALAAGTFTGSVDARDRRERVAALGHPAEIAELGRDGVVFRVVARGASAAALASLPHSACDPAPGPGPGPAGRSREPGRV